MKNMSIRDLRNQTGMNQTDFWRRLNVTQTGGSRYECGRPMPTSIQVLLKLVYGTDFEASDELNKLRSWREVSSQNSIQSFAD